MELPILFGYDKNKRVKTWQTWTQGDQLFIEHGKLGGKMQVKQETVEPTNVGRANYRDGAAQAIFEAESRYKKQLDKNYRPTIEELEAGDVELLPLLAVDYKKQGHRIKFPCYGSPKLDGVRCLAIMKDGVVTLRSRGGKDYHVEHIQHALNDVMQDGEIWDGELYIHGLYLEEIVSAVKKPNGNTPHLKYYVFDIPSDKPYSERSEDIKNIENQVSPLKHIEFLADFRILNEQHLKSWHDSCVRDGYEGLMIRNVDGKYEWGKRSADLQKFKEMIDEEFECVGIEEDRNGNAVLVLYDETAEATFTCCFGDFEERKRQLSHPNDYIGRYLTVAYQARYKDSKLAQFPVGKAWRDVGENGEPLE